MANCLYSGDKPLGIVQSNAEDVAYDSNTSVKEAIDGVVVLSIPANTYASWNLALTAIRTAFQALTSEEQKRAIIKQSDRTYYQNREGVFTCVAIGSTASTFLTIFITSGTIYYGNMTANASGNTFYNDTSQSQDSKIELWLL